ncbi:MAG: hypothetical protein ACOYLF_14370 [Blastocatellia bacterium]
MSGNIFDELREAAKRKAQELEEKYDLRAKVEEGLNAATEAAREQFARIDDQYRVTENLKETAARTGVDEAARAAEAAAREVLGAARGYYQQAGQAYNFSSQAATAAGAVASVGDALKQGREWMLNNPGKAAVVTLSIAAGIRAGAALPALGLTLLGTGAGDHWLFHSALPVVGLRMLGEQYEAYLRSQEERLAANRLDEAERERLRFHHQMAKYVGAPLLGAFSIAAGASLLGAALSGATVSGLPLSLLLGGNPLLNGIWFFANGVICISEGYRFFMIALADEAEIERIVREVRALLPA